MPKKNQMGEATGRLIDLDHAESVDSSRELRSVINQERLRKLELHFDYVSQVLKSPISKDVLKKDLQFDTGGDEFYMREVIMTRKKYFNLKVGEMEHEINLADLGWDKDVNLLQFFIRLLISSQVQNPPDFTEHESQSDKQVVRFLVR